MTDESINYLLNKATESQITEHLLRCDRDFEPQLSKRVEIKDYAQKIASKATRFEAWTDDMLIGLVAAYFDNQENRCAYITSVSVLRLWTGSGIATRLLGQSIEHAKTLSMHQIGLEVGKENASTINLYKKSGFVEIKSNELLVTMNLCLENGEEYEQQARL